MSEAARDAKRIFDATVADYYRAWFRYRPEAAVDVGVEGYGERLTPFGDDAQLAVVSLNNALLVGLNGIERSALNPAQRIDYDVLFGAASLENQSLLELAPHRIDPGAMLPINALHQLTQRPVGEMARSVDARLRAIPAHLEAAKAHLRDKADRIPALWRSDAIVSAVRGADYIKTLAQHPKIAAAKIADVETLAMVAAHAVADFAQFLQQDIAPSATAQFACGAEYFSASLRLKHFLDVDTDALYAFGESLYAETERDLKDAAADLGGTVAEIAQRLRTQHPPRDALLQAYAEQMQAARAFVIANDLVTVPPRERLDVIETPEFLRHQIPFAAYSDPAPNDPAQHGYYYVTPPETDAELAEHDVFSLMHTCVHEAWPGHHLQFVTANTYDAAHTLPRLLNASATLYEGWALYCEQLMHEQGFLSAPEQRFILLRDRLWRALRITIDIDIHTRGVAAEAAGAQLSQRLGFATAQAMAEITWYSKAPTVPLGYATGWALINATRDRLRATAQYSLKDFHDRLLREGSVALPLAIQSGFGNDTWRAARSMVFPV